ncbi:MAG: hypothetical protein WC966_02420 [Bradymonadales bacterium]|jgi:hypothetical protein
MGDAIRCIEALNFGFMPYFVAVLFLSPIHKSQSKVLTMFPFNPRNGMLHPLWWGALFLLVLNDFILKASPFAGTITGKLSDFAGLLMFPLFLAFALRVRQRGAWLSVHLATAAVFSALKLSAGFSAFLSAAAASIGLSFYAVVDPSDLIALSVLPLSFWLYPRLRPLVAPNRRSVVTVIAALFAGFATVATGATPVPRTLSSHSANLMLADLNFINMTGGSVNVQVQELALTPKPDCSMLSITELRKDQFISLGTWEQPNGEGTSVLPVSTVGSEARCKVVLLTVDDAETILLYWNSEDLPIREVPVVYGSELQPEHIQDATIVVYKEGKRYYYVLRGMVGINYWKNPINTGESVY